MKSFPSGHAQIAVCCAVFFIVSFISFKSQNLSTSSLLQTYLQRRRLRGVRVAATFLVQLTMLVLALYCGYSRVLDRRHHLTDVMAGSVLGAVVGFLTSNSLNVQSLY